MKKSLLFISVVSLSITTASSQTIAAAFGNFLSLCNDNTVQSWGANYQGELGNGTYTDSSIPVSVSSLTGVISVAAGAKHGLALQNDGTVWSWGFNPNGQLGNGTTVGSNIPVNVSSLTGIIAISGGNDFSLALKNDGTVWSWGYNAYGQLGNGNNTDSDIPVQVLSLSNVTAISGGGLFGIALKDDGTVWAWGNNSRGELGDGTMINSNTPVQVNSLTGVVKIIAGSAHSLILKNDSTVWAWGMNCYGQLGDGTTTTTGCSCKTVPVQSLVTNITDIAAGSSHSLALKNDNTLWTWGYNSNGQLGNGTNTDSNTPSPISSFTGVTNITAGYLNSLVRKNDGTGWAWGEYAHGAADSSNVPIQVSGLCSITTGVNEVAQNETQMNVFPNPANRIFTLNINNAVEGNFILRVNSSLGKTIYTEKVKIASNSFIEQVDLNALPKGIYFLEMQQVSSNSKAINRNMTKLVLQ